MLNGLKDRMLNISSSAKRNILLSTIFAAITVVMVCTVCVCCKQITIIDRDSSAKQVITFKRYVEEVLDAQGIKLGSNDKLNVAKDDKLKDNMKIEIYRAFHVSVTEKGITTDHIATRRTVGEILNELGYNAKKTDKTTPAYTAKVSEFDEITLIRTAEKVIKVTEEIPYESTERENKSLQTGKRKVVQKGAPGEKTVSYKILFEDGVEVSREALEEEIITKAVAQITEVGPKKTLDSYKIASAGTIQTSRSGNLAYSKVITANATAYDASSCGKAPSHPAYGITATGRRAGYGIVAVDPSIIPLGTKLYIESADGSYVYGTAIAADTGGAIKGNRIDLCYNTRAEAIQFGRRQMKVYILN
ncbi:MAG: G5 domain-containing protein [Clostridia bacterium]|nr:G5 domain-containing protein [Clostridia bacterium]